MCVHIFDLYTDDGSDLLIVGLGETMMERLEPELVKHLRSKGISVEQMNTVRTVCEIGTGSVTCYTFVLDALLCS